MHCHWWKMLGNVETYLDFTCLTLQWGRKWHLIPLKALQFSKRSSFRFSLSLVHPKLISSYFLQMSMLQWMGSKYLSSLLDRSRDTVGVFLLSTIKRVRIEIHLLCRSLSYTNLGSISVRQKITRGEVHGKLSTSHLFTTSYTVSTALNLITIVCEDKKSLWWKPDTHLIYAQNNIPVLER